MTTKKNNEQPGGWETATWDGACREQLRHWSRLSLEEIVAAQEEMAELSDQLSRPASPPVSPG